MKRRILPLLLAAAFLATVPAAHAALVAYWPFNDAATLGNDTAGGTVLTANGGASFTATGKTGGGLALSGNLQFLSGTVTNLPIGNSAYTQAAWIKPTALGARGIIGWGNYTVARQVNAFRIFDGNGGFRHYWWAKDLDATATNLMDGNWHHAATTYDGTNRRIYLDGVQIAADVPIDTNGATAANFAIGRTYPAGNEYFQGTLDEVYIYSHALSAAEVQLLASNAGPIITSFTVNKTTAYEGEAVALSWNVNTSTVTGTFSYEIKYGAATLSTGAATAGTFNTVVPDLTGTAQTVTWTFRAIETGGNNVTRSLDTSLAGNPGIPTANGQAGLTAQSTVPLNITLTGSDPNGGSLNYIIVTPPAKGTLSAGNGAARTYTSNPGIYGADEFTFKVSDGKYESAIATVKLSVLTPPLAPTDIILDDVTIRPENVAGDFLSTISTVDSNAGEPHTYTLVNGVGGEENGNFTIMGHQLRAAVSFAGLVGVPQRIRIRSTDGSGFSVEEGFTLSVTQRPRGVVINEIHYNSPNNTVRNSFIELHNDGEAADLTNWRLSGGVDYLFPAGTQMAPGSYLLIAEDPPTMLSHFGKTALGPWNNAVIVYPDGSKETSGLSNDGDTVRLRNQFNNVVTEVDYGNHSPWPAKGNGEGSSIELINPALDETHGSNWAAATASPPPPAATYVAAATSGWKYFKGTVAPAATWKNRTGADLTNWLDGTTTVGDASNPLAPFFGFGYLDADDAVLLNDMRQIAPNQIGYQAVYFRKEFTIPAGQMPSALALRVYVDDGCIVYINGMEIPVRFYCTQGTPQHGADTTTITGVTFSNHECAPNSWDSYTINNLGNYNLVEGTNVIAILAANDVKGSSDFSFNLELKQVISTPDAASPGAQNTRFAANNSPAIRNVNHAPKAPTSTDPIIITARITDPNGVASASLAYQICTPGNYIPSTLPKAVSGGAFVNVNAPLDPNPAFELPANWITVAMNDDGLGDDALDGDGIWTATIPPQANRTLVRYRITVADNLGASARVPYVEDPSLNFACFVYNGVPAYEGTSSADLQTLPVYHFLTRKQDYDQAVAYDANASQRLAAGASWSFENWEACFVCNGVVYDHIPYRLKGANGRYTASGTGGAGNAKRAFKFLFNKGYEFDARDQAGNAYPEKWSTMITENLWENRASYTFSLNEMVSFHLLNQLGIPAPRAHWSHFRTIMQTAEQPDKWHGDFWGLMWVHEDYDRRFLKAHDLKKGNLYKLTRDNPGGLPSGLLQFRYQSTFAPTDASDHDELLTQLKGTSTPAYIQARVNLDLWCRYHSFCEAVRHYDYWPSGDNNAGWYFYPLYNAANGNKGQLWYLPNDLDATWGPTWNNGHDLVHNALFNDSASTGGDASTNPTLWPNYFNQIREVRALLWQPNQVNPLIDEFAAVIRPFVNAEFIRWHPSNGAPVDAGNFGGLNGPNNAALNANGQTALNTYVASMKDFAFDADNNGSVWPGGNMGVGGSGARLDTVGNLANPLLGGTENSRYPATPTITFTGTAGFPLNDLRFSTTAFSDPNADAFAGIQWRMAEVNTSATWTAGVKRLLEINASHDTGALATFAGEYKFPVTACEPGKRYRARVRMKDSTGRWSFWSNAMEFTAGTFDPSAYASQIVVSEIMYHAANATAAEQAVAAALVPPQAWNDDSFDYVELRNISASPVDLTGFQFTGGFDFIFPDGTMLAPGANILVVQDVVAFNTRYGAGKPVIGAWSANDRLSNGGEILTLQYGLSTPAIFSFAYDDDPALNWPASADGGGPSLVRIAPHDTTRDPGLGVNWRVSGSPGGTPGGDDIQTFAAWLTAYGEAGELTDTDFDGLGNLLEYALSGNPAQNSTTPYPTGSIQQFTVGMTTDKYMTLTFRRANTAEDLTQHVEFSSDLASWPVPAVQVSSLDHGNGTRTEVWRASVPISSTPKLFGRVRFTQP